MNNKDTLYWNFTKAAHLKIFHILNIEIDIYLTV